MNIFDFLAHLRSLDIRVTAENGKLLINAPTGAVTPELRSELAARKEELLSVLSGMDPIQAAPQDGPLPLSLAQENLWQLHRLTPDTVAYNMYAVFHLCGTLNVTALDTAIQMVAERHEILRTSFPRSANGSPEQVIAAASTILLQQVTFPLSDSPQDQLQSLIQAEIRRPFDLTRGPLFRPILVHLSSQEYVLILVMHHIISDGHSFSIFYEELGRAYRAASEGIETDWLLLPLQYTDYAAWQRKWLATEASASDRDYWQSHLSGDVPALELPFDRPHPLQIVAEGDTVSLAIEPQLGTALRDFCRREGITLFTAVLTVFNLLLHRHSGQHDLVVCTPMAARDRVEFNRLIGYFNNTLLLRTDLSRVNTIRELLQENQKMTMGALAHQMFPFMEVAGFPNLVRMPLSRAMVAVLEETEGSLRLPRLDIEIMPTFNFAVQYDLSLEIKVFPNRISGQLMYRKALFDHETVENLAKEWVEILQQILSNADRPIGQFVVEASTVNLDRQDASRPPFTAPRNDLERRLAQIWQEVLQVDQVGIFDEFFELGGHSLLALRLFTRIEKETGTNLPLSTLFETTTIAYIARLIEEEKTGTSWDCLVPIQSKGSKPPVFLVHGIGGGVLGYRDLANEYGDDRPFYGLQAVGQDGRQAYDLAIEEMVSRYIEVMRSHQPSGPYHIGGYCFGGVVAYEMAIQLEKIGERVSLLALFESAMPDTMETRVSLSQRFGAILKSIPVWVIDYSNMDSKYLLNRFYSFFTKIWSKIQRNPNFERRIRVEETLDIDINNLPSRNIELTEIHLQAALQYQPAEYSGVVTLFRARNRSINEVVFGSLDPKMGWGQWAKGGVKVCFVDGFHRNMHLAPYAKSLAAELKSCLDREP